MIQKTATTVKICPDLYDEFKILGIRYKLTLQGLIEKTVFRYVKEDAFRNGMNSFIVPQISSSYASVPVTASASASIA